MRNIGNKNYFIFLFTGISLLAFVCYFTHLRYTLIRQSNDTAGKTNDAVHAYEELSDDYKSAVIIYSSTGLISAKYLEIYAGDAHDILADGEEIKRAAQDVESTTRADTLLQQLTAQSEWILKPSVGQLALSNNEDGRLKEIFETKAVIERGETHVRELATSQGERLKKSFSSIYQWLLMLIGVSATVIIGVVISILWHVRKDKNNVQKLGLQKGKLDEIAWIQSHKVRSQVATILGLTQLFAHDNPSDEDKAILINGLREAAEKLDDVVREIDAKTRVAESNARINPKTASKISISFASKLAG